MVSWRHLFHRNYKTKDRYFLECQKIPLCVAFKGSLREFTQLMNGGANHKPSSVTALTLK